MVEWHVWIVIQLELWWAQMSVCNMKNPFREHIRQTRLIYIWLFKWCWPQTAWTTHKSNFQPGVLPTYGKGNHTTQTIPASFIRFRWFSTGTLFHIFRQCFSSCRHSTKRRGRQNRCCNSYWYRSIPADIIFDMLFSINRRAEDFQVLFDLPGFSISISHPKKKLCFWSEFRCELSKNRKKKNNGRFKMTMTW